MIDVVTKRIVGLSGGIDSQATSLWVRRNFPAEEIILMNSDAGGNEDPITINFIDEYSRDVFPVVRVNAIMADMWKTPGFATKRGFEENDILTFGRMIDIKGRPPSRKAQFCTEILKLRPQKRWVDQNVQDDYERYVGLRRDESDARKNTPDRQWDTYFDCWVNFRQQYS